MFFSRNNQNKQISSLTRTFLDKYDDGTFSFPVRFRDGARITCKFGLAEGYRVTSDGVQWDSIRFHTGVDRGTSNGAGVNVVVAPFDFNRSAFIDYGSDHPYGSMIRLFNDKFGFELRIVHMDPRKDIEESALELLQKGKPVPQDLFLGRCGNYGFSYGAHTHTEVVSLDERSSVLEELLKLQFGEEVDVTYESDEQAMIQTYRTQPYWIGKSDKEILDHYESVKKDRRIVGIANDYKMQFTDWFSNYQTRTRYSSQKLFNGM